MPTIYWTPAMCYVLHIRANAAKTVVIPIYQLRKPTFREVRASCPVWNLRFKFVLPRGELAEPGDRCPLQQRPVKTLRKLCPQSSTQWHPPSLLLSLGHFLICLWNGFLFQSGLGSAAQLCLFLSNCWQACKAQCPALGMTRCLLFPLPQGLPCPVLNSSHVEDMHCGSVEMA